MTEESEDEAGTSFRQHHMTWRADGMECYYFTCLKFAVLVDLFLFSVE